MVTGIDSAIVFSEIESIISLLERWKQAMADGLPMVDVPGTEDQLQGALYRFRGELLYVSDKCASLADRIVPS